MAGLAPNGRWNALEQIGVAAVFGEVFTYENGDRGTPKVTYPSIAEIPGTENSNPVRLDSDGGAFIYWVSGLYSIDVYDRYKNLIYSADNYPVLAGTGTIGPITVNQSIQNLLLNADFTNWNQGKTSWTRPEMTPEPFQVSDCWFFGGSAADSTTVVEATEFSLGQIEVPDNPVRYLSYRCTDVGSGGELDKFIMQPLDMELYEPEGAPYPSINGVQALANQTVTLSFYAKSATSSTLELRIDQFFGTGGSPSAIVETNFPPVDLTATWTRYIVTVTVPNINGKVLGTNNDSTTRLVFAPPLNTVARIDLAKVFLQRGAVSTPPPYRTPTQDLNDELLVLLGNYRMGTHLIGWSSTQTLYDFLQQSVVPLGSIKFGVFPTAPDGWLIMDDGTIGDSGSGATNRANADVQALYELLWDNTDDAYCPVSGGRGASAADDFLSLKTLRLPLMQGRVAGATGSGAGLSPRILAENVGEELHALTESELAPHGHPLSFRQSGFTGGAESTPHFFVDGVPSETGIAGSGLGHNTMQPTTFFNFIIRY